MMLLFVVGGSMLWITCAIGETDWHLVMKTTKPYEICLFWLLVLVVKWIS